MLPSPSSPRQPKQQRSQATKDRIAQATIELLGEIGEAGLTHRAVATRAGVSLATTTYHYASKFELLEHASSLILNDYTAHLRAFAARQAASPAQRPSFEQFMIRLLRSAAGRYRPRTLAWCEIMQIAARNASTSAFARVWYMHLREIWSDIATQLDASLKPVDILAAIDRTIGLQFVIVSLGLSPDEAEACFLNGLTALAQEAAPLAPTSIPQVMIPAGRRKGEETRQQLLDAAICLMAAHGTGAVTGRSVAAAAGVAPAVPSYYYKPIDTLIDTARQHLYQAALTRYRESVSGIDRDTVTLDQIADLTTAVLTREVTQFGDVNLAILAIETEAARQPPLRPMIDRWFADRARAWHKLLARFDERASARHGLFMSSLFIGMQIRLLATGTEISALGDLRLEFLSALDTMGFEAHIDPGKNLYK